MKPSLQTKTRLGRKNRFSARLHRINDFDPGKFHIFHLTSPDGELLATGHIHPEVAEKLKAYKLVSINKGVVTTKYTKGEKATPDDKLLTIHAALIGGKYIGEKDPNNGELLDVIPIQGKEVNLSKSVARCPRTAMTFLGFVIKSTFCVVHDEQNGRQGVWLGDTIFNPNRPTKTNTKDGPGGTVSAGESYLKSFIKEVFQEVGLRWKKDWYSFLGPLRISRMDAKGLGNKQEHILVFGFDLAKARQEGWVGPDFQLKATERPPKTSAWAFYPVEQVKALLQSDNTLTPGKAAALAYGMWKLGLLSNDDLKELNSKRLAHIGEKGANGSIWRAKRMAGVPIRFQIPKNIISRMVVRTRPLPARAQIAEQRLQA